MCLLCEKVPYSGSTDVFRVLDKSATIHLRYLIVKRSLIYRRSVISNDNLPRHLQATALSAEHLHLLYARIAIDGYKYRQTLHN